MLQLGNGSQQCRIHIATDHVQGPQAGWECWPRRYVTDISQSQMRQLAELLKPAPAKAGFSCMPYCRQLQMPDSGPEVGQAVVVLQGCHQARTLPTAELQGGQLPQTVQDLDGEFYILGS